MKIDLLGAVKQNTIVIGLACLATVAMLLISEAADWQTKSALADLRQLHAVRLNIQLLNSNILDAESAQRGYLLTNRREYLEPYEAALKKTAESFDFLEAHYKNQPAPIEILNNLRLAAKQKLSELATTIELFDAGKSSNALEVVLSGIGKEQMERIRFFGDALVVEETGNIAESRKNMSEILLLRRIGIATLSFLALLGLLIYQNKIHSLEKEQKKHQKIIQTERDRLEIEVTARTVELTELTHHLQTTREDERSRISRDLHDELGALLTSAKLDAARIKSRLGNSAPEAVERLAHMVETLNSGIALKRRIIEDLCPSALKNLGLKDALEIFAREFAERSGVVVKCDLQVVQLNGNGQIVVYRLVQEAITNITKYANARNVWVALSNVEKSVDVSVRDDGVGFDMRILRHATHGLVGMRYRVEAEGGELSIVSKLGEGVIIKARIPQSY